MIEKVSPLAIFDVLPGWVWATIVAALLLVGGGAISVQSVRLANKAAELAQEKEDRAKAEAAREKVAREDALEVGRLQARHASKQQEVIDGHIKRERAREKALAVVRDDNVSLRGEIALYASGGGGKAESDPAACGDFRDRASTLGLLLERTLKLAERHTSGAEKHADEVRTLKGIIANDRASICGAEPG